MARSNKMRLYCIEINFTHADHGGMVDGNFE